MVTYNRDIPDANNNPSTDQPLMKTNTNAIDDIFQVDHVSFNVANGGQHKAITFNTDASYVPVPPVSPPELFVTFGGVPALRYYSGTAAQSSDQYSIAANFSTFLFGGIILKGGSITLTANLQTITYTALVPALAAFPTATLAVYLMPSNSTAAGRPPYISAVTATSFTVTDGSVGIPATYYFLAIGN